MTESDNRFKNISLNNIQSIQKWWESRLVPEEERTAPSRFTRMLEEVDELRMAVEGLDGTPDRNIEAGYEAVDVIIIALGVIDALGLDAERLMDDKIDINFRKYNIVENGKLRDEGMTPKEAMSHQKSKWTK